MSSGFKGRGLHVDARGSYRVTLPESMRDEGRVAICAAKNYNDGLIVMKPSVLDAKGLPIQSVIFCNVDDKGRVTVNKIFRLSRLYGVDKVQVVPITEGIAMIRPAPKI